MGKRNAVALVTTSLFIVLCASAFGCAGNAGSASSSAASSEALAVSDRQGSPSSEAAERAVYDYSADELDELRSEGARELQAEVEKLIEASGLDAGVAYIDPDDATEQFAVNGDKPFAAASVIKLAVIADLFDEVDAGTLSLDDTHVVAANEIVGGTGVIGGRGAGTQYTLRELAEHMISDSDNTAANILIEKLGMDHINKHSAAIGLKNTTVRRLMMDTDAIAAGIENETSASDAAKLLAFIMEGAFPDKELSNIAFEALYAQNIEGGIEEGVPDSVNVAHKTGSLAGYEHDAAIICAEEPYALVVMAAGGAGKARDLAGDISEAVWKHRESDQAAS